MAFVTVPKDLSKVKSKVAFNLTRRQILCFGAGALVGIPFYIATKGMLGTSVSGICMVMIMLPFFFLAMFEKDGLPFEKIMVNYIKFLMDNQIRTYQTDNYYTRLEQLEDSDSKEANIFESKIQRSKKRKKKK